MNAAGVDYKTYTKIKIKTHIVYRCLKNKHGEQKETQMEDKFCKLHEKIHPSEKYRTSSPHFAILLLPEIKYKTYIQSSTSILQEKQTNKQNRRMKY